MTQLPVAWLKGASLATWLGLSCRLLGVQVLLHKIITTKTDNRLDARLNLRYRKMSLGFFFFNYYKSWPCTSL